MVGDPSAGEYNLRVAQVKTLSLFLILANNANDYFAKLKICLHTVQCNSQVERGDEGYYECQVSNTKS